MKVVGPRTGLVAHLAAVLEQHGIARLPNARRLSPRRGGRGRTPRGAGTADVRFRELGASISAHWRRGPTSAHRLYLVSALRADGTTNPAEVRARVRSIRAQDPDGPIFVLLDERNPAAVRAAHAAGATSYFGAAAASNREAVAWRIADALQRERNPGGAMGGQPLPASIQSLEATAFPHVELTAFEEPSAHEVEAARTRADTELARLPSRAEALRQAAALISIDAPELREPQSGRLDARRIAERVGVSISRIAPAVGVSQQALSARPDSLRAQEGLLPIARVVAALDEALPAGQAKMWLRTPHARLGGVVPLEMLLDGRAESLARMVEGVLEGLPG